jgi:hypothetical protein
VDAESACSETATLRLGHQPGIGDAAGKPITPDLELFVVAKILGVKADDLFPRNLRGKVKEMAPHYRVKLSRGQVPPTV